MLVVNAMILEEFIAKYPQARRPVLRWLQIASIAIWKNLAEVKVDFNSVDYVKGWYIFNIKGNSFRLVTTISFATSTIVVIEIMTHHQYDRKKY